MTVSLNRRRFVQLGFFGGTLLAASGLALWPTRRKFVATTPPRFLSERAFSVLAAVAARVVSAPDADPQAIAARIDASLVTVSDETRAQVGQLLLLFDNALAGLLFDGHVRPFTALASASQDEILRQWRDSRLLVRRSGYQALRRVCLVAHYSDKASQAATGYPGPRPIVGLHYDDTKAGSSGAQP